MDAQNKNKVSNWDSRSIGKAWQHYFFYIVIRFAGLGAAYFCMYFVVLWYVLFFPSLHKRCKPYLSRRFPDIKNPLARLINEYRWITSFAKSLIDRAAFGILGPKHFHIEVPQSDQLQELSDQNKGVIILNAHAGCWQIAFSALEFKRATVHLVMHRNRQDIDRHYFEHDGSKPPFEIIDPEGYLGGTLQMAAILQEGDVLGLMGDRIFGDQGNAVTVEFLGGPIKIPVAPYRLAAMRGTPIAILFSHRSGKSRYRIEIPAIIRISPGINRNSGAYLPYAEQFIHHLTQYTEKHPFEFFNFFQMWDS